MRTSNAVLCAFAFGVAASAAVPAQAASDEDLAAIRQEMKALRGDYESKIRELEKRLKKAEARPDKSEAKAAQAAPVAQPLVVEAAPPPPPVPPPAPVTPRAPASASAFNPSISVALNGTFSHIENDPGLARIPGFQLDEEAGLFDRGLSLGESEIALTANVDHILLANLIVAFGNDDSVGVEEAYVQTTSLPWGLTAKAGRSFSGIGYLNERHAHDWDFFDASLPYRAFLGGQYGDDGIEVRWLAPTDFFLQFGAEMYRGDAFPAGGADDDGAGTVAAFVKTGGDLDDESSWLASLSYLGAKAQDRDIDGDIFTGDSQVGIASLVYKWAPNGNATVNNLIVNGEFFFGNDKGTFNGDPLDLDRTGWYVQGVYQIMPQWRVGLRYAALESDGVSGPLLGTALDDFGHSPAATTALLEYDTSEFGRLRLQYTYDDSDLQSNNEITAGYTVIIGPHGAHRF
jgi:hypothetical protein